MCLDTSCLACIPTRGPSGLVGTHLTSLSSRICILVAIHAKGSCTIDGSVWCSNPTCTNFMRQGLAICRLRMEAWCQPACLLKTARYGEDSTGKRSVYVLFSTALSWLPPEGTCLICSSIYCFTNVYVPQHQLCANPIELVHSGCGDTLGRGDYPRIVLDCLSGLLGVS